MIDMAGGSIAYAVLPFGGVLGPQPPERHLLGDSPALRGGRIIGYLLVSTDNTVRNQVEALLAPTSLRHFPAAWLSALGALGGVAFSMERLRMRIVRITVHP